MPPYATMMGILLNDPILLKLADDKYWFSIADSDILLWVKASGVRARCGRGRE